MVRLGLILMQMLLLPSKASEKTPADPQNPLLAASNATNPPHAASASGSNNDDDKLSDYVPDSRDLSVSRAVSWCPAHHLAAFSHAA